MSTLTTNQTLRRLLRWLTPNGGTLLLLALFLFAQSVGAIPLPAPSSAPNWPTTPTINYQGRLANSAGDPISDTLAMQFSFFDSDTGGALLWGPETHPTVAVTEGLFSVALGQLSGGIPSDVLSGDLWLEIRVDGETLSPREQLRAVPFAMQASVALTVPDGAIGTAQIADGVITSNKFAFTDNRLDIQRHYIDHIGTGNAALEIGQHTSSGNMYFDLEEGNAVAFRNNTVVDSAPLMFFINKTGALKAYGDLDMSGHAIINQGAMVEANLQTPAELAAERIDRFSQGDVLCWAGDRLERCSRPGDPLVQAIADENGKPIVIGAEVIKVIGPVRVGDLLVASEVPGYAVVDNDPAPGAVIAQALDDFDGEHGVVRAMIRKF